MKLKFAIVDLLALTLLSCLTLSILVKRQAISATALDLAQLRAATERAADDCQQKEREIELFMRTIKRRAQDLDRLSRVTDHAAQLFNQAMLPTVKLAPRQNVVSTIRVPTYSRSDEFRVRKKIYVPDGHNCELRLSFVGCNNEPDCYVDFEKPERCTIPLVEGENLIEVHFDGFRRPNSCTLTNHTNGIAIKTLSKKVHRSGRSFGGGQSTTGQENFPVRDRLPTVCDEFLEDNTRLVVQMVESTNK
jgi:hypothetical protein